MPSAIYPPHFRNLWIRLTNILCQTVLPITGHVHRYDLSRHRYPRCDTVSQSKGDLINIVTCSDEQSRLWRSIVA